MGCASTPLLLLMLSFRRGLVRGPVVFLGGYLPPLCSPPRVILPAAAFAEPRVERAATPKIPSAHDEIGFGKLVCALRPPSGHLK